MNAQLSSVELQRGRAEVGDKRDRFREKKESNLSMF